VACWNVCPARIKDITRIAELGSGNVDDCLGVSRLYFCAVRNVETSSQSDCELKSEAGRKPGTLVDVRFGSGADILGSLRDVRCTPESRHPEARVGCPLYAKSGDRPDSFGHVVGAHER
jgi:hypothetical protein